MICMQVFNTCLHIHKTYMDGLHKNSIKEGKQCDLGKYMEDILSLHPFRTFRFLHHIFILTIFRKTIYQNINI